MTVTISGTTRIGNATLIEFSSDLSGTVYFHVYADGAWVGKTEDTSWTLYLEPDDQVRVEVQDTTDAAYDPIANAPAGWPARRTLFWTRPDEADVASYLVEENEAGGGWSTVGTVYQDATTWSHRFLTDRLTDLTAYQWRITPYDAAGNAGTAITFSETVVRTPDGVDFTATLNTPATTVTLAAS